MKSRSTTLSSIFLIAAPLFARGSNAHEHITANADGAATVSAYIQGAVGPGQGTIYGSIISDSPDQTVLDLTCSPSGCFFHSSTVTLTMQPSASVQTLVYSYAFTQTFTQTWSPAGVYTVTDLGKATQSCMTMSNDHKDTGPHSTVEAWIGCHMTMSSKHVETSVEADSGSTEVVTLWDDETELPYWVTPTESASRVAITITDGFVTPTPTGGSSGSQKPTGSGSGSAAPTGGSGSGSGNGGDEEGDAAVSTSTSSGGAAMSVITAAANLAHLAAAGVGAAVLLGGAGVL